MNFFEFLGISFIRYLSFSEVKKLLRKYFYWNMSFCDNWGNTKNRNEYWVFSMLELFFLQKYKAQLFHLGVDRKPRKYTTILQWKICGFMPCVIILIVRNFRKMLSLIIHLDNQLFFSNYWFHSLNQVLNQKLPTCRGRFAQKTIRFHPCVKLLVVQRKFLI